VNRAPAAALADLRTALALLRGLPRGASHRERLERFYAAQAGDYDRFRDRLLRGRRRLMQALPLAAGAHLVELGGGTGRNLEFLGGRLTGLASATVVDLCEPLLAVARARFAAAPNVHVVHADATRWRPPHPVDAVVLSYALTMIPDWRAALDNALAMLAPDGVLGVVDFHVCGATPPPGIAPQGPIGRAFWPRWFAHDGVHLSAQHLPALLARCRRLHLEEGRAAVPLLPGARVPWYLFAGSPRR